jgi:hypothetical protein
MEDVIYFAGSLSICSRDFSGSAHFGAHACKPCVGKLPAFAHARRDGDGADAAARLPVSASVLFLQHRVYSLYTRALPLPLPPSHTDLKVPSRQSRLLCKCNLPVRPRGDFDMSFVTLASFLLLLVVPGVVSMDCIAKPPATVVDTTTAWATTLFGSPLTPLVIDEIHGKSNVNAFRVTHLAGDVMPPHRYISCPPVSIPCEYVP